MPLLLLSKSNPLRWASIWVFFFLLPYRFRVAAGTMSEQSSVSLAPTYFISQSALMPLLLLSKSNPLRWASIWVFFFLLPYRFRVAAGTMSEQSSVSLAPTYFISQSALMPLRVRSGFFDAV